MHGAEHILWDVLDEHLDEAAFDFERWELGLDSPRYRLVELAEGPEAQMLAHVDGLVVAGERALDELLIPALEDPKSAPRLAFVAAYVVLAIGSTKHCGIVAKALDEAEGERWRALVRALELSERAKLDAWIAYGMERCPEPGLAGRLRALAARGWPPDERVFDWLAAGDARVVEAACRWLGSGAELPVTDQLRAPLVHDDADVRCAAMDAACAREPRSIWRWLVGRAKEEDEQVRTHALMWVALLGNAGVHARMIRALGAGVSLWPLSFTGRVAAVDAAIELLGDDELGPAAGELVQAIAGLPDDDEYWDDARDEAGEAELDAEGLPDFEQDDLDAELVPGPEAELRRPRPEAVAEWWARARPGFEARLRHLGGQPMTTASLVAAFEGQPCRRRHGLGLEVFARTHGRVRVPTRGLSPRQQAGVGAIPELELQLGLG